MGSASCGKACREHNCWWKYQEGARREDGYAGGDLRTESAAKMTCPRESPMIICSESRHAGAAVSIQSLREKAGKNANNAADSGSVPESAASVFSFADACLDGLPGLSKRNQRHLFSYSLLPPKSEQSANNAAPNKMKTSPRLKITSWKNLLRGS